MNKFINSPFGQAYILSISWVFLFVFLQTESSAQSSNKKRRQGTSVSGSIYPQFRSNYGSIHWLPEQMPLKVYVSRGQSVEKIIDPVLGVSAFNVDNLDHWPDLAANLFQQPEQLAQLPIAQGYLAEYYQAVIDGINQWKLFEKEGLFSFVFTDDPSDADIYIFWINHFVTKMGFGLLANDIRGYTAKRSFWYKEIMAGAQPEFKPVLTLIRTTNQRGEPRTLDQMRAAAAHEFGHALGIEGHSANPQDLMSLYYGRGNISPNDAATVRHLYRLTPDLVP